MEFTPTIESSYYQSVTEKELEFLPIIECSYSVTNLEEEFTPNPDSSLGEQSNLGVELQGERSSFSSKEISSKVGGVSSTTVMSTSVVEKSSNNATPGNEESESSARVTRDAAVNRHETLPGKLSVT